MSSILVVTWLVASWRRRITEGFGPSDPHRWFNWSEVPLMGNTLVATFSQYLEGETLGVLKPFLNTQSLKQKDRYMLYSN